MICNPAIFSWADPSIAWVAQNFRNPWLDIVFVSISTLGEMPSILITISLSYWFWNKKIARLLAYATLTSVLINTWLKDSVMECRPPSEYWLQQISADSYSFPSGHAQVTIVLWAGFAYFMRSKLLACASLGLGLLIALSRPYIGVHYFHDSAAGLCIGLFILILFVMTGKKLENAHLSMAPKFIQKCVLISLFAMSSYLIISPTKIILSTTALLLGLFLGFNAEQRRLNYIMPRGALHMVIATFIGLAGIFILRNGVRMIYPYIATIWIPIFKYAQYMLIGIWISYFAPKIFNVLRLSRCGTI
jgi:membrane-associated phospholipid phosphatase